jgi:hypothetical protein
MSKARTEAFSDSVELTALGPSAPSFLSSYGLSFIYLGIYWSNHHHTLYVTHGVNAAILWANLHLLFWLSLVPFVTGWMGENHFAPAPTAAYGVVLLLAAIAYLLLQRAILGQEGPDSTLAAAAPAGCPRAASRYGGGCRHLTDGARPANVTNQGGDPDEGQAEQGAKR